MWHFNNKHNPTNNPQPLNIRQVKKWKFYFTKLVLLSQSRFMWYNLTEYDKLVDNNKHLASVTNTLLYMVRTVLYNKNII